MRSELLTTLSRYSTVETGRYGCLISSSYSIVYFERAVTLVLLLLIQK